MGLHLGVMLRQEQAEALTLPLELRMNQEPFWRVVVAIGIVLLFGAVGVFTSSTTQGTPVAVYESVLDKVFATRAEADGADTTYAARARASKAAMIGKG